MSSKSISVIICGDSVTSSSVVKIAESLPEHICIMGHWDNGELRLNKSNSIAAQNSRKTFSNLLQEPCLDFIIMCSPPMIQLKTIRMAISKMDKTRRSSDAKSKYPAVVLIPPVSPGYNSTALSDAPNLMGIAMPMRKLSSVFVLISHFKRIINSFPLQNVTLLSHLPSYWMLGSIRTLHIRLNVTNPVFDGQYSWLCEPGLSGGGLLNLYCPGLIDLAYCLTNGLHITSVSCLRRTFDPQINGKLQSIRRITAEDYLVVIAELESRFEDEQGPVLMIGINSDPKPAAQSMVSDDQKDLSFRLVIELSGSSGQFILPECGKKILWTPTQWKSERRENLNGGHSGEMCATTTLAPSESQLNGDSHGSDEDEVITSNFRSVSGSVPFSVKLRKGGRTEVASVCTKKTSGPCDSSTEFSSINPLQEAWTHWFSQLSSVQQAYGPKQISLDSLIATPDQWAYIQRVLLAIEKSTKLRRWVHVATGETL